MDGSQEIKVVLRDKERIYTKAYIDFLDCEILSLEETVLFLMLKSLTDFRTDINGTTGRCAPSLKTLCDMSQLSTPSVRKVLSSLGEKGVVIAERRGLQMTNVYIVTDREQVWKAGTVGDMRRLATETDEERAIRISTEHGWTLRGNKMYPPKTFSKQEHTYDRYLTGERDALIARDKPRIYIRVYNDFLHSGILSATEAGLFILLKRFLNVKNNDTEGCVFPSVETLAKKSGKSTRTITRTINSLVDKGVIEKKRRGVTRSNLYFISDRAQMWTSNNFEELKKAARETELDRSMAILEKAGYRKEPAGGITDIHIPEKEYTVEDIKKQIDYDGWAMYHPDLHDRKLVEACIGVICETMNSSSKTMTIDGEPRKTRTVKSVFLALTIEDVLYAIDRYQNTRSDIKRPMLYLRTLLYRAGTGERTLAEENKLNRELREDGYDRYSILE